MMVVWACNYQTFTRYQVASLVPDTIPCLWPFFLYVWHAAQADREEMREEAISGCQAEVWLPGMALRSVDLWLSSPCWDTHRASMLLNGYSPAPGTPGGSLPRGKREAIF